MLYMIRPGVAERISQFVADGGTFVATYWSGIVDENDRCFLGGFPGPLRKVLGIWAEEIDALYDGEVNYVAMNAENNLGLNGVYKAQELCEIIHLKTGEALGVYKKIFTPGAQRLPLTGTVKAKPITSLPIMKTVFRGFLRRSDEKNTNKAGPTGKVTYWRNGTVANGWCPEFYLYP